MTAPFRNREWSPNEVQYLMSMVNGGCSYDQIAKDLGRSRGSVKAKWQKIQADPPKKYYCPKPIEVLARHREWRENENRVND